MLRSVTSYKIELKNAIHEGDSELVKEICQKYPTEVNVSLDEVH